MEQIGLIGTAKAKISEVITMDFGNAIIALKKGNHSIVKVGMVKASVSD